jgi:TatD DNase family protein
MLIDSHCHIPDEKYEIEADQIVKEAKEAGVEKLITIGTSLKSSRAAVKVAKEYENVYAVAGVYPHEDMGKSLSEIKEGLSEILSLSKKKIIGVGECGLDVPQGDVPYKTRDMDSQRELFKLQLGLAVQRDFPVVLHNRNADIEMLDVLQLYENTGLKGVSHCFSSHWEFAKNLLDLGLCISFAGMVTYPSVDDSLLEVVKKVPKDKLLVETDAPYLPPQGHRGEINYPKYVKITAAKVADIRNSSFEEISKQTYQNTCRLFKIWD